MVAHDEPPELLVGHLAVEAEALRARAEPVARGLTVAEVVVRRGARDLPRVVVGAVRPDLSHAQHEPAPTGAD